MFRRAFAVVVLVLSLPLAAFAQGTERYLPSGSQIVLQVDSYQKTKAAYDRTVQGQMMQGDTGKFVRAFYKWILESAEIAANEHQVLAKEDITLIKDAIKVFEKLGDEGMALGIEVNSAWPPEARLVVVLPKMATGQSNILKLIADLRAKVQNAGGGPAEIKEVKIGGRSVSAVELPMVNLAWWAQGDDFLLTVGTEPVANYIKMIDDGKTGLAKNATYKKLLDIGTFPTRSRAYLDLPSLAKLADKHSDEAGKTVDELGLKSIGPIFSISGYDGPAIRSLTEMDTIGPRKGFAQWMSDKKITLADLPPMPSDLTTFTASNANVGQLGSLLDLAEKIGKIYAPDQVDNIKAGIKGFEDLIGVDLRGDLFDSFDNMSIHYSSPSEGFLGMGGASLFKVKDEAKLKKALATLIAAVPQFPGIDTGFKKRMYRGVEIYEFHMNSPGSSSTISFATYKGYFAFANYPQPIQGYILRVDGVLPSWKADERLTKAMGAFSKEFTSFTFTDPRPSVEAAIAAAPALISIANGFTGLVPGLSQFDIGQIPHAQEATRNLFPNISISTDDGKRRRMDQRLSVGW